MKVFLLVPLLLLALLPAVAVWSPRAAGPARAAAPKAVLVIHGGAGVLSRKEMTPALEKLYRDDLTLALRKGHEALQRKGGTSLDAVVAAIRVLEDSPRFNAGKGAVFTHDGRNELDASIMEGKKKQGGAVAGVRHIKNPILAARAVMEHSEHVLLVGRGAELFATRQGLEIVDPSYFWTRERWLQLNEALRAEEAAKKRGGRGPGAVPGRRRFGTVGAVALDRHGNLAAGTSTGGMTNKRFNRVGDSPILGAGTYADNEACAVSCTGHGEIFIRYAVAHDVVARMKYGKRSVAEAAAEVIRGLPKEPDGVGGLIALDPTGNVAMPYDSEGMYRGFITRDGTPTVFIYDK